MAGFNPRSVDGSSARTRRRREEAVIVLDRKQADESYQDRAFFNRYRKQPVFDGPGSAKFRREAVCAVQHGWFVQPAEDGGWVEAQASDPGAKPDLFRAHDFLMTYIDPGPRGFNGV